MTAAKERRHAIDVSVGARLRQIRLCAGLSQDGLARKLGVTFQQVQKYERGTNRVSASVLWESAQICGCNVADFFSAVDDAAPVHEPQRIDLELARALQAAPHSVKRAAVALVRAASGEHAEQ